MHKRLNVIKLNPEKILNNGCGDEILLAERYPKAEIMNERDILSLPSCSVDLIFSNLLLPWERDYTRLIKEWRRVLRENGVVLFSSLGPDTSVFSTSPYGYALNWRCFAGRRVYRSRA